jgi:hypothetical protein
MIVPDVTPPEITAPTNKVPAAREVTVSVVADVTEAVKKAAAVRENELNIVPVSTVF